jgi:hypothetical protein
MLPIDELIAIAKAGGSLRMNEGKRLVEHYEKIIADVRQVLNDRAWRDEL